MLFKIKKLKIELSFYFLLIISFILVTDQSKIAKYFVLSILIHELGHLIFILYYKIKIDKISFKIYGINIKIEDERYLKNYKDIILLLGGSLANFLAAIITCLFLSDQDVFIMTNLILGVFNLFPVDSLDGGKMINIILFSFLPMNIAYNIILILNIIFIAVFSVINFLFIIHGSFNLTLTILCLMLIFKVIRIKEINL